MTDEVTAKLPGAHCGQTGFACETLATLAFEVLHDELQDHSYLRFVHPAEPLDEVVDGLRPPLGGRKGRTRAALVPLNTQAPLTLPGTLSTARALAPVRHALTSLSIANSSLKLPAS